MTMEQQGQQQKNEALHSHLWSDYYYYWTRLTCVESMWHGRRWWHVFRANMCVAFVVVWWRLTKWLRAQLSYIVADEDVSREWRGCAHLLIIMKKDIEAWLCRLSNGKNSLMSSHRQWQLWFHCAYCLSTSRSDGTRNDGCMPLSHSTFSRQCEEPHHLHSTLIVADGSGKDQTNAFDKVERTTLSHVRIVFYCQFQCNDTAGDSARAYFAVASSSYTAYYGFPNEKNSQRDFSSHQPINSVSPHEKWCCLCLYEFSACEFETKGAKCHQAAVTAAAASTKLMKFACVARIYMNFGCVFPRLRVYRGVGK